MSLKAGIVKVNEATDSSRKVNSAMSVLSANVENSAIQAFLAVLFAVDPTGLLLRLAQILKIVNKLRFIRVEFGSRLYAFLKSIGDLFKIRRQADQSLDVRASVGYRGSFSDQNVDLQFESATLDKMIVYGFSWLLVAISSIVIWREIKAPKWLLIGMYWQRRIHFVIVSLFFADFLFFGFRTILHGKTKSIFLSMLCAHTVLALISLDFFLIMRSIFDNRAWKMALLWRTPMG